MRSFSLGLLAFPVAALVLGSATPDADAFCKRACCCPPPPPIPVVLQVCHPCTGCKLDVPVCLPACCSGAPCVHFQNTLLGDGKTVFTWPCGHEVIVRYTRNGGYRVHERG